MNILTGLRENFDAILFDLGNTLIYQDYSGRPISELQATLKPGVREVINRLSPAIILGIVSNTNTATSSDLKEKLAEIDFLHFFGVVVATADCGLHKPSPAPLLEAARALNVEPSRILYVGDLETDNVAATLAGMSFMYSNQDLGTAFVQYLAHPNSAYERGKGMTHNEITVTKERIFEIFDGLVKPPGSLGKLEVLVAQIASIQNSTNPTVDPAAVAVFAGDHGVASDDSVTPWPQFITTRMTDLMVEGTAAISILAKNAELHLEVINVGGLTASKSEMVRDRRVAEGTADLRISDAMTIEQTREALEVGAETAERLISGGSLFLLTGEVGIGNTTPSAALISYLTSVPVEKVTGRGSGIDDETYARKIKIIEEAVARVPATADPEEVLAKIGGLEIAALVGFIIRSASLGVPVLLDGVITLAAALVAVSIEPECLRVLIASHCSVEPGARVAIEYMGLDPILDLGLRLGEGTGAALAFPLIRGGVQAFNGMARIADI